MSETIDAQLLTDINDLMKTLKKSQECDVECQKERREKQLYSELVQARRNMDNAPLIVEDAENKYFQFTQDPTISKMKENRVRDKVSGEIEKLRKSLNEELSDLETLANYSNALDDSIDTAKLMVSNADNNLSSLDDNNELLKKSKLSNRRLEYIKNDTQTYQKIAKKITYLFWFIYVLSFVVIVVYRRAYIPHILLYGAFVLVFRYVFSWIYSIGTNVINTILRVF